MPDITWIASSAGQASEPSNWSLGRAPQAGDRVIWGSVSSNNCQWNLDALEVTVDGWVIEAGYTGTVTQGAVDIGVGAGGVIVSDGLLTPNSGRMIYCAGPFMVASTSMLTSSVLRLTMTGEGQTLRLPGVFVSYLRIAGNTTIVSGSWAVTTLIVDPNKTMSINAGIIVHTSGSTVTIDNQGTIAGPGALRIRMSNMDISLALGRITATLQVKGYTSASSDRVLTLVQPETQLGPVEVASDNVYTCTLDTAGHPLSASSITIGTRGAVLWRDSVRTCSGNYDSSAASGDDAGTSRLVMTGSGTLKVLAGAPLNDLWAPGQPINLASDVTVAGKYVHAKPAVLNGYTLTLEHPELEQWIRAEQLNANRQRMVALAAML